MMECCVLFNSTSFNKLDIIFQKSMTANILKDIKQRIQEQGNVQEIVELVLQELGIPAITNDIKKLFEKAKNLEILILADNDLENVNNLPKLDLTVLDLSSNKINDAALQRISQFQDLGQLLLPSNEIKTLEGLKPLFKLKKLMELDLSQNLVAQVEGYRQLLFKQQKQNKIPSLQILDDKDKEGNQVSEDDEYSDSDEDEYNSDESVSEEDSQEQNNMRKGNKK